MYYNNLKYFEIIINVIIFCRSMQNFPLSPQKKKANYISNPKLNLFRNKLSKTSHPDMKRFDPNNRIIKKIGEFQKELKLIIGKYSKINKPFFL